MKKTLLKIRYPRLLLLLLTFVIAYVLFSQRDYGPLHSVLVSAGYFGTFLAGCFYAYGFTAAPATAVLLSLGGEQNLFLAATVGGLGALIGDLVIFFFIRYTFKDEIRQLFRTKVARFIEKEERIVFGHLKKYAAMSFAGFIIASPLPTEVGVTLLASSRHLSIKKFALIAYCLHFLGILAILAVGKAL